MQFVCVSHTKGHCHHYSVECHLPFDWLLEKSTDILGSDSLNTDYSISADSLHTYTQNQSEWGQ